MLRLSALLLLAASCAAQTPAQIRDAVRTYRQAHEAQVLRDFAALLDVPNVATDRSNIALNATRIADLLRARDVSVRLLPVTGAPPIVFGELTAPGARRTLIFYAHYDGQPVQPSDWSSPPWQPTLRRGTVEEARDTVGFGNLPSPIPPEWRLYARSAGDDKAPIQALLSALDALRAAGRPPSVNIKFFFEGEEEAGSPHLPAAIQQYRDLLAADAWLLCDGPVHQSRRMQVFFGARGIIDLELALYGPVRPLHSGHYGNWAPNPAAELANLLASLRDRDSHILIPGFYDDVRPLTSSEQAAIRAIPDVDAALREELQLATTESRGAPLPLAITQPALNVRGLEAGHVAPHAQNAVPTVARASIDFRLVPDQQPQRVRERLEAFLKQQGYNILGHTPTAAERRSVPRIIELHWGAGYPAARTSMELPISRAIIAAIEDTLGQPIVKSPLLGGSIPMYLMTDVLRTPVIGLPIANHDDNQHAANENLRIQNLWDGIEIFAGILTANY
jgi:acetylornithine deacetylase/succinyl-diaminopimelate desuccinylase-like protein